MSRRYDETVMKVALESASEMARRLMTDGDTTEDQRKVLAETLALHERYRDAFTGSVG